MPSDPQRGPGAKTPTAKLYLFALLGASALLALWIIFVLVCSPADKLVLLGVLAGLAVISFFYFRAMVNEFVMSTAKDINSSMEKIKNSQKTLQNEEKVAVIAKFASVLAHELKNPLSSLKNIAYYLIKTIKQEDPKGKRMMEMLSSEVDRTDRMIVEFSEIARAKRVSKVETNVSELVENTLNELSIAAPVELEKDIEPAIEAVIDPERIARVLKNIVKNAKDAVGPSGGRIKVSLKREGVFFELAVRDFGAGMPPETLEQVFDPLFTTKNKSLGLGLSVVKDIVAVHNGRVKAESEVSKGSVFRVLIPTS